MKHGWSQYVLSCRRAFGVAGIGVLLKASLFGAAAVESLTYEQLSHYSIIEQKLHPEDAGVLERAVAKYGKRSSYSVAEIQSLEGTSSGAEKTDEEKYTPPTEVKPRPRQGWEVVSNAITHPKLRHDYTDVLAAEDPSQQSVKAGKFSDLTGASFSYAWDGKNNTDTWSAEAALLVPMIWSGNLDYGIKPVYYGLVPSVSLDRVVTNGDPKNDVDSLIYRAGVFGQWLLAGKPGQGFHARINFRGSFTYATDTKGDLQLPAGEFDLEPQIFSSPALSLGYVGEILYDPNRKYDDPKRITMGYQLRAWIHGEYGSVQRDSTQVALGDENFFRLGPVAQLRVFFPKFFQGLTLSAEYHYLPTLSGADSRNWLFKAGAELTILDHTDESGPRVTLALNYFDGGLDLTKEQVNTLTIGLGVLF